MCMFGNCRWCSAAGKTNTKRRDRVGGRRADGRLAHFHGCGIVKREGRRPEWAFARPGGGRTRAGCAQRIGGVGRELKISTAGEKYHLGSFDIGTGTALQQAGVQATAVTSTLCMVQTCEAVQTTYVSKKNMEDKLSSVIPLVLPCLFCCCRVSVVV